VSKYLALTKGGEEELAGHIVFISFDHPRGVKETKRVGGEGGLKNKADPERGMGGKKLLARDRARCKEHSQERKNELV